MNGRWQGKTLVKSFAITGSKEMGQWLEAGVDRDTGRLLEMEDNMACCYAVVRIEEEGDADDEEQNVLSC